MTITDVCLLCGHIRYRHDEHECLRCNDDGATHDFRKKEAA